MIEVKDRVPSQVLENGAIRYEEFDANGNSLGYKYIKRADEPTEVGTPINKVLFDSIQSDLDSITVGRYFKPVHSFIYEDILNTYSRSYVPIMSSSEQDGFKVTGSTSSMYLLFADDQRVTMYENYYAQIELDSLIIPKELSIKESYATHYKILASLDGTNFDVLQEDVETPGSYGIKVIDLSSNENWYKYIKLQAITSNSHKASNFKITKAIKNQISKNNLQIPINFKQVNNQRLTIETPSEQSANYSTQLEFQNVTLSTDATLKPSERYELIYADNALKTYKDLNHVVKDLSIKTGTISNDGIIPKTSGYNNYLYIVAPNNASNNFNESKGYPDNFAGMRIYCSVDQSTRKVTAYTQGFWYSNGNSQGWVNKETFSANYYEIAWN